MVRRLIALLLLLATAGSALETVAGELRDGAVHHETGLAAAQHSALAGGEHGHEHGDPAGHQHGGGHEHGTSTDHCTHQHGSAMPSEFALDTPSLTVPHYDSETPVTSDRSAATLIPPPRA